MPQKILIVEDNAPISETLREYVEKDGYQSISAQDYANAQNEIKKSRFDLVLLDLNLPDGNGIDILKSECAKPIRPPFIIITGDRDLDKIKECITIGAIDFITKPVNYERLSVSVKNALNTNKAPNQPSVGDFKRRVQKNVEKLKVQEQENLLDQIATISELQKEKIELPKSPDEIEPMAQYQLTIVLSALNSCDGDVKKTASHLEMSEQDITPFMDIINKKVAQ